MIEQRIASRDANPSSMGKAAVSLIAILLLALRDHQP
jgi:hypothetical protein